MPNIRIYNTAPNIRDFNTIPNMRTGTIGENRRQKKTNKGFLIGHLLAYTYTGKSTIYTTSYGDAPYVRIYNY